MDDLLNYQSPDPQPTENPYARSQSFSGSQLGPNGPTNTPDPSAYGNNTPHYYTDLRANLNNAGPATHYQPIPQGSGAGVFSAPSQFATGYYVRVSNRGTRSVRVAQGWFAPNGSICFRPPVTVDDASTLFYDQATPGQKYPLLLELPSKALYFRVLTIPTGQNQLGLYVPFESELQERRVPCTNIGPYSVYADSVPELQAVAGYLAASLSAGPQQPPQQQQQQQQQQFYQQPQQPQNVGSTEPVQGGIYVPPTQTPPPGSTPSEPRPATESSPLSSLMMLGLGVLAAKYMKDL